MHTLTIAEAICEGLREEMERDPRVFDFGGGLRPPPTALPAKPGRSLFSDRIGPASPRDSVERRAVRCTR